VLHDLKQPRCDATSVERRQGDRLGAVLRVPGPVQLDDRVVAPSEHLGLAAVADLGPIVVAPPAGVGWLIR
jgi:hypothetical protein